MENQIELLRSLLIMSMPGAGEMPQPDPNLNNRGNEVCPPFLSDPNNILINKPHGFVNICNNQGT